MEDLKTKIIKQRIEIVKNELISFIYVDLRNYIVDLKTTKNELDKMFKFSEEIEKAINSKFEDLLKKIDVINDL